MTVASLMEEASARDGLREWGGLGFTEPFEILLGACRSTARLTPMGWDVLRKVVLRHLRNRLHLHAYVEAHRHELVGAVCAPVVVTGMPRTGTTLLHNLLALDAANRVLPLWQALHPVPPEPHGRYSEPELVRQASAWLERLYALAPAFRSIHGGTPSGPEECDALLQNEFASQHFDDMFDAEEYSRWLYSADLTTAYASYALQLRVLTPNDDGDRHWALKSPSHLAHLGELLRACPGATVVHCHRHPLEAVPSYASLIVAVRAPYTDRIDPVAVGRQALWRCATATSRALAVREVTDDDAFVDVAYRDLLSDPIGVVRTVYDRVGRTVDGALEAAMRAWLAENPQHRHGRHRYSLEQFGLSRQQVTAALADYLGDFSTAVA